eukprot:Rmarinus@m.17844
MRASAIPVFLLAVLAGARADCDQVGEDMMQCLTSSDTINGQYHFADFCTCILEAENDDADCVSFFGDTLTACTKCYDVLTDYETKTELADEACGSTDYFSSYMCGSVHDSIPTDYYSFEDLAPEETSESTSAWCDCDSSDTQCWEDCGWYDSWGCNCDYDDSECWEDCGWYDSWGDSWGCGCDYEDTACWEDCYGDYDSWSVDTEEYSYYVVDEDCAICAADVDDVEACYDAYDVAYDALEEVYRCFDKYNGKLPDDPEENIGEFVRLADVRSTGMFCYYCDDHCDYCNSLDDVIANYDAVLSLMDCPSITSYDDDTFCGDDVSTTCQDLARTAGDSIYNTASSLGCEDAISTYETGISCGAADSQDLSYLTDAMTCPGAVYSYDGSLTYCQGRGTCSEGQCECDSGYYGYDCSSYEASSVAEMTVTFADNELSNAEKRAAVAQSFVDLGETSFTAQMAQIVSSGRRHLSADSVDFILYAEDEETATAWAEGVTDASFQSTLSSYAGVEVSSISADYGVQAANEVSDDEYTGTGVGAAATVAPVFSFCVAAIVLALSFA